MKTIALCTGIREFNLGAPKWNDKDVCDKYPGSHWVMHLEQMARDAGTQVISGKCAYQMILDQNLDPNDVSLVQEQTNEWGRKLIEAHAKPALVFCLESPLYDPFFYDHLHEIKSLFKRSILFGTLGTDKAYFPSFDELAERIIVPFAERQGETCIVASNKHYSTFPHQPSFSYNMALNNQLHDARYKAIHDLKAHVYGKGWPDGVGNEIIAGKKIDVIRNYKYSICYENISMEGYVTEKVIECLVAGNIPMYLGAPDIEEFVPKMACFNVLNDSEETIKSGQHFLDSDEGKKFSYQSFARKVLDCVLS